MTAIDYRAQAQLALEAGWIPTEAYDESGQALWLRPGLDGLVTLAHFSAWREHSAAA